MKKLEFPKGSKEHIVPPSHSQREASTSATSPSADLGPLPGQVEFQNLFWNKTLVSLEGVSNPRPDRVWIRPSPVESPSPVRIPKLPPPPPPPKPYRPHPNHHLTKDKLGFTGLEVVRGSSAGQKCTRPAGRPADHPRFSSRITVLHNHEDVRPPHAETPSPMVMMLPAQIEFQDAFWGRIQVTTARLNKEFIDTSSTFNSSGLALSRLGNWSIGQL